MDRQRGVVLIVSLVFLLLLTLLATSSMQNATLQEKVAASVHQRHASFQSAEGALRQAEAQVKRPGFALAPCSTPMTCAPPAEVSRLVSGGVDGGSGIEWVPTRNGFYGIQHLGQTSTPANPGPGTDGQRVEVYRITAIGIQGWSRTVLESVHSQERRILWRQRQ